MMKKNVLTALFLFSLFVFVSINWIRPVCAEEGDNKYGGIFKIAFFKPAMNFGNPLRMQGPDKFYADFCLQRLIQPGNNPGEFEPLLATSWELSPDSKSYVFHLRRGVKFHDGTVFNAQAVKWNLDRVLNITGSKKKRKTPRTTPETGYTVERGTSWRPTGQRQASRTTSWRS